MGKMPENIDYTIEIDGSVSEVAERLNVKLSDSGYGVLSTIDVQKILLEKNKQSVDPYLILDVCNPAHAGNAIEKHKGVGLVLPCKISVYREYEKTKVSLLRPTSAIGMTGYDDLKELASNVEKELQQIIKSMSN